MRLVTFEQERGISWGVRRDAGIVETRAVWPDGPDSVLALLQGGDQAMRRLADLAAAEPTLAFADAKLLAPIPQPPKLLGLAVNYLEHHREWDRGVEMPFDPAQTTTPRPFLMPATCVIGPDETIPWPVTSEEIDYEVELAVVIGRRCHRVAVEQARECVAGYTIANDISARGATHADGRADRGPKDGFFDWLHGKWADGFCPLGPCLVTADEIDDPQALTLELDVNGERRQHASTDQMIFDVDRIVSFCSHLMTLLPGDVIATGTPSGVGKATGRYLQPGDRITCRIQGIGEITNTLGPRPAAFYRPCL
jgi:2-keto-4-pentenoate hydratase/2-oxohepta-3-ene-1,7-dioic acid hydratase in catechol pathway